MNARKIKSVTLPKSDAFSYLKKAKQFFHVMQFCTLDEEWDAAILNGVHAAISITDAILVQRAGIHSISQRHEDAAILLQQHFRKEELNKNEQQLLRVLNFKSLVSYQPDLMKPAEARNFTKDVERYFEWAEKFISQ